MCGWNVQDNDGLHFWKWTRGTSKSFQEENVPSPEASYDNEAEGHFIIASNIIAEQSEENTETDIISPIFKSSEHPVECFAFYYNFGVSFVIQECDLSNDFFS